MGRGKTIIMKITHSLRNKYQFPCGKGNVVVTGDMFGIDNSILMY